MNPQFRIVETEPRYTLLSGHPASNHQSAIFDALADPASGSKLVIAVAGAGKTTVIKNGLRYIPPGSVQGFAFNTDAAKNLKAALEEVVEADGAERYRGVRMGTFHSVCYGALLRHLGLKSEQLKPNGAKIRYILKARLTDPDHEKYASFVAKLVGLAKGEGIGALCSDEEWRWYELVAHHGLYLEAEDATEERGVEIARKTLAYSNAVAKAKHDIDFDDMLYLVLLWKLRLWQNDLVFVDECQDTNPVRRAIARLALKRGGRLYAVGDPKQCQPSGTLVSVTGRSEPVPIEDLKVGDQLVTYNNGGFPGINTQGRILEEIYCRDYEGDLLKISTETSEHEITPNHRCHVRMTDKPGIIVYAMLRDGHARVGRTMSSHGGDFGLAGRSRQERSDKSWILKFFEIDQLIEAQLYEMQVAYQYGLPQVCFYISWVDKGMSSETKQLFWQKYPTNLEGLERCLIDHNLLFYQPFWSKEDGTHVGSKYSFITAAANLSNGWMKVCVFNGTKDKPVWEVASVTRRYFKGLVWSLKVQPAESGRRLYIANKIVTHNSIYGFTGASTDAMDLLRTEFGCGELPLTVSYRCARSVVRQAQEWVDYIEPAETAPEGEVRHEVPLAEALSVLTPEDTVLCRQTAPLIDLAYKLIAQGRGCRVLGREIGEGLIAMIKAMKARGIDRLVEKLEAFRIREIVRFTARGEETRAEAVGDRVDCVMTIIRALPENERTVPALERRIAALFDDNATGVLTLATVHKAKGQEWVNVAILRPDLMPSRAARTDWARDQEINLQYVAATRAKLRLLYLAVEE